MEMTKNKESDNYMKQMFKTCENAYTGDNTEKISVHRFLEKPKTIEKLGVRGKL